MRIKLLYPDRCPVCLKKVGSPGFCDECGKLIDPVERYACTGCARGPQYCTCVNNADDMPKMCAVFYYNDAMKQSVAAFKFRSKTGIIPYLGSLIAVRVKEAFPEELFDVVIPMPIGPIRMKKRGYNQCDILAKHTARGLGVAYDRSSFIKWLETPPQSRLDAERRRENVLGAYRVKRPDRLSGKNILLVDDIVTTGATAHEAARTLIDSGAKNVIIGALCVTKVVYKYERGSNKLFVEKFT